MALDKFRWFGITFSGAHARHIIASFSFFCLTSDVYLYFGCWQCRCEVDQDVLCRAFLVANTQGTHPIELSAKLYGVALFISFLSFSLQTRCCFWSVSSFIEYPPVERYSSQDPV